MMHADDDDSVRVGDLVVYMPEEGGRKRGTVVSIAPYMIMREEERSTYVVIRRAGHVLRCLDGTPDPRPARSELISRIGSWMRTHQPWEAPRGGEVFTVPTGTAL